EFLVNDADAHVQRGSWVGDLDFFPLVDDAARIFSIYAGEHFHHRRLARAVLAEQSVHLAAAQLEAPLADSVDTGKALLDALHQDQNIFVTGNFVVHNAPFARGDRGSGLPGADPRSPIPDPRYHA